MSDKEHQEFEKIAREKIKTYTDKLKTLPEYKKAEQEQQTAFERIASNQAIREAEDDIKSKYKDKFKLTRDEIQEIRDKDKVRDRIKKKIFK